MQKITKDMIIGDILRMDPEIQLTRQMIRKNFPLQYLV